MPREQVFFVFAEVRRSVAPPRTSAGAMQAHWYDVRVCVRVFVTPTSPHTDQGDVASPRLVP